MVFPVFGIHANSQAADIFNERVSLVVYEAYLIQNTH